MPYDWTGSLEDGSIEVYNASSLAVEGTQDAVNTAINNLKEGKIKVFNTSKFSVNGTIFTTYKADVNTDENYLGDTEVISDGYFHESEYRSAPYFDIIIDGIEDKDKICFIFYMMKFLHMIKILLMLQKMFVQLWELKLFTKQILMKVKNVIIQLWN
jgi:hypothetical protein